MLPLNVVQFFQSNEEEVRGSNNMEKIGLVRCLDFLREQGSTVSTLITDRHMGIQKYMREEESDIKHFYDVWHVAKGTPSIVLFLLFLLNF